MKTEIMEAVESAYERLIKQGKAEGVEETHRKSIERHLLKSKLSEIEIAGILDVEIVLVHSIKAELVKSGRLNK